MSFVIGRGRRDGNLNGKCEFKVVLKYGTFEEKKAIKENNTNISFTFRLIYKQEW